MAAAPRPQRSPKVLSAVCALLAWLLGTSSATANLAQATLRVNGTDKNFTASAAAPTASRALSFDANGNARTCSTTSPQTGQAETSRYGWDARDKLCHIENPRGIWRLDYDPLGRMNRISEYSTTSGAALSHRCFVWAGLSIIEERATTSTAAAPVKEFYPGGEIRSGQKYFYTRDHLGSIREVVNEAGAVVARYDYDPFGVPTRVSGSFDCDFLFTGHFYHAPSGLYLAPFRAYDPALGRWLSREPLGLDGPNPYHYAFNDPLNIVDPTGLQGEFDEANREEARRNRWASDWNHNMATATYAGDMAEATARLGADTVLQLNPVTAGGVGLYDAAVAAKQGNGVDAGVAIAGALPFGAGKCTKAATTVTGDALKALRQHFNNVVQPRFWKDEAVSNASKYSAEALEAMRKGKAPTGSDGYPLELHHKVPLSAGGTNERDNLVIMTQTEHRRGSNFRINHPK